MNATITTVRNASRPVSLCLLLLWCGGCGSGRTAQTGCLSNGPGSMALAVTYSGKLGTVSQTTPILIFLHKSNDFDDEPQVMGTITSNGGSSTVTPTAGTYYIRLGLDLNGDQQISDGEPFQVYGNDGENPDPITTAPNVLCFVVSFGDTHLAKKATQQWDAIFSPPIALSACGSSTTWSSQAIDPDAAGKFGEIWAPQDPNLLNVVGELTNSAFTATLQCVGKPNTNGSMSGTWNTNHYAGTFAFEGGSGGVMLIPKESNTLTLQGTVVNTVDEKPVEGAVVWVAPDPAARVTTNAQGQFYLKTSVAKTFASTPYMLTIEALGYQAFAATNVWGDQPTALKLQLTPDAQLTIATRTITVDGLTTDWDGLAPIVTDSQGDDSPSYNGDDIRALYLAKDSQYLYIRMDLWAPPNPLFGNGPAPNDGAYYFEIEHNGNVNNGTLEFGLAYGVYPGEPFPGQWSLGYNGSNRDTTPPGLVGPEFVGVNGTAMEIKVPLALIGNPTAFRKVSGQVLNCCATVPIQTLDQIIATP